MTPQPRRIAPLLEPPTLSFRTTARIVWVTAVLVCGVFLSAPTLGAGDRASPIERAIAFLSAHQLSEPLDTIVDGSPVVDFPGDWPQFFALRNAEAFRVRDVSPFTVGFIHHALTQINERNRQALGLKPADLQPVRLMRRRAVDFMKRFESPAGAPDAGTFAFWPYDRDPATPDPFLTFCSRSGFEVRFWVACVCRSISRFFRARWRFRAMRTSRRRRMPRCSMTPFSMVVVGVPSPSNGFWSTGEILVESLDE
jgi:hypothetical protein